MERTLLIGLDTNVLVRFVMEDDQAQVAEAQALFDALAPRKPAYVSLLVLCEFAWTLGRFYKLTRAEVALAVDQVLSMSLIQIERPNVAMEALHHFRGSRADFGDCCMAALGAAAGCEYTYTFDKAAAKLPGMRLLGALQP